MCVCFFQYSKACVKQSLSKRPKIGFKTNYRLMQVKSIAECEHSAILSTFIKLLFVKKILVLSILSDRFTQALLYVINFIEICESDKLHLFLIGFMGIYLREGQKPFCK